MADVLRCSECDKPIDEGQALWYDPFASGETDGQVIHHVSEVSRSPLPNGLPFHKACLKARLPDVQGLQSF
jgi:hypothetical protein